MAERRVMIFIDGSNVYHSLKDSFQRTDIDFERFCTKLTAGRELVRIYYYNAPVDQQREPQRYKDQQRFFQSLRNIPYFEVRLGRLIYRSNQSPYEKGVDVRLATDMVSHAFRGNYDIAILVSGDTDFADALQTVKNEGKHVEVALFGSERTSQRLREVGDRTIPLDETFLADCWK